VIIEGFDIFILALRLP